MRLIDSTFLWTGNQSYGITDTFEMPAANGGPEVVRIVIHVDAYAVQSYARADILSKDRTWTTLCTKPASSWFKDAPSYTNKSSDLKESFVSILSAELADRASNIVYSL